MKNNRFKKILAWLVSFLIRIYTPTTKESLQGCMKVKVNIIRSLLPFNQKKSERGNVMKCAKNHFRIPQNANRKRNMKFSCHKIHTWTLRSRVSDMKYKPSFVIQHHFGLQETGRIISINAMRRKKKVFLTEILIV